MPEYFQENLRYLLWDSLQARRVDTGQRDLASELASWLSHGVSTAHQQTWGHESLGAVQDHSDGSWHVQPKIRSTEYERGPGAESPDMGAATATLYRVRAKELLAGEAPTAAEIRSIADASGRTEDEVRFERLLGADKDFVLRQNMKWLIKQLGWGGQRRLAQDIGADETDVSKWASGKRNPPEDKLESIAARFSIPRNRDLRTDPLFLLDEPVGELRQRQWLRDRIDALDAATLDQLFPALERILRDP